VNKNAVLPDNTDGNGQSYLVPTGYGKVLLHMPMVKVLHKTSLLKALKVAILKCLSIKK
jgi:hypothetical protein